MQVTPYWTTGNVGVEMKAMAGMKKKEVPTSENLSESWYFKVEKKHFAILQVGFISRADMPHVDMFEIVQACNQLAGLFWM